MVENAMRAKPVTLPLAERGVEHFRDPTPNFYVIDAHGHRHDVQAIYITVEWQKEEHFVPFAFRSYFDQAKGTGLYGAAVADISVRGLSGEVVLLHDEKGTQVSFVPRRTQKKAADT
jgi:hypothetical protein